MAGIEDLVSELDPLKSRTVTVSSDLMYAHAAIPSVVIGNSISYLSIANKLHVSTDEFRRTISMRMKRKKRKKHKKRKDDFREYTEIDSDEYDTILNLQCGTGSGIDIDNSRVTGTGEAEVSKEKDITDSGISSFNSEYASEVGDPLALGMKQLCFGSEMIKFQTLAGIIKIPPVMIKITRLSSSTIEGFLAESSRPKTSSNRFYEGLLKTTTPKPVPKIPKDVVTPKRLTKVTKEAFITPQHSTKTKGKAAKESKVLKRTNSEPLIRSKVSEAKKRRISIDSDSDPGEGLVWVQPNKPVRPLSDLPKKPAKKIAKVKEVAPKKSHHKKMSNLSVERPKAKAAENKKVHLSNGEFREPIKPKPKPPQQLSLAPSPRFPIKSPVKITWKTTNGDTLRLNGSTSTPKKTNGKVGYTDEEVLAMIKPKSVADMPRIPKKSESMAREKEPAHVPETPDSDSSTHSESPERSPSPALPAAAAPLPSVPDLFGFFGPCADSEDTGTIRLIADPVKDVTPNVAGPTPPVTPDDDEDLDILNIHAEDEDDLF